MKNEISRRDALKLTGAALGSMTLTAAGAAAAAWDPANPPPGLTEQNTLFKALQLFRPGEPLAADEMRVSFMGTSPLERPDGWECAQGYTAYNPPPNPPGV